MRLDKLSKITCVFVLALWAGPSAALAEADCATWNTRQFFAVATPADMARCLEAGANLEARGGKDGLTPLHMAAVSGSPDLVQALVQAGANLEVRDMGYVDAAGTVKPPLHLGRRAPPRSARQARCRLLPPLRHHRPR